MMNYQKVQKKFLVHRQFKKILESITYQTFNDTCFDNFSPESGPHPPHLLHPFHQRF